MGSLALQSYAFLVVVLTGIAWSVAFDFYRAWRDLAQPRRLAGDLADLAFGALSAVLVAAGLFLSNWGDLRLYVFLGLVLGAAIYHWLARPVVQPAARWSLLAGWRWLQWIWRGASWPVRLLVRAGGLTAPGGRAAVRSGTFAARAAYGCCKRWLAWCRRVLPLIRG